MAWRRDEPNTDRSVRSSSVRVTRQRLAKSPTKVGTCRRLAEHRRIGLVIRTLPFFLPPSDHRLAGSEPAQQGALNFEPQADIVAIKFAVAHLPRSMPMGTRDAISKSLIYGKFNSPGDVPPAFAG